LLFIGTAIEKLQRHQNGLSFPRELNRGYFSAARSISFIKTGAPILLGNRTKNKRTFGRVKYFYLKGIRIINPSESEIGIGKYTARKI
jgi:phosphotransacetylase